MLTKKMKNHKSRMSAIYTSNFDSVQYESYICRLSIQTRFISVESEDSTDTPKGKMITMGPLKMSKQTHFVTVSFLVGRVPGTLRRAEPDMFLYHCRVLHSLCSCLEPDLLLKSVYLLLFLRFLSYFDFAQYDLT